MHYYGITKLQMRIRNLWTSFLLNMPFYWRWSPDVAHIFCHCFMENSRITNNEFVEGPFCSHISKWSVVHGHRSQVRQLARFQLWIHRIQIWSDQIIQDSISKKLKSLFQSKSNKYYQQRLEALTKLNYYSEWSGHPCLPDSNLPNDCWKMDEQRPEWANPYGQTCILTDFLGQWHLSDQKVVEMPCFRSRYYRFVNI